jgi:hypothetical protein
MDYSSLVLAIKKYLKRHYHYRINFDLKFGKPLVAGRSALRADALYSVNDEVLELLLQQMYEDGFILKDDGQTVEFSTAFVFD